MTHFLREKAQCCFIYNLNGLSIHQDVNFLSKGKYDHAVLEFQRFYTMNYCYLFCVLRISDLLLVRSYNLCRKSIVQFHNWPCAHFRDSRSAAVKLMRWNT